MSSRDKILSTIRESNVAPETALPSLEEFGRNFDEKFDKFSQMLQSVGGEAIISNDLDATISALYPDAQTISCNESNCKLANIESNAIDDPHELKNIDLAIVRGEFAVSENGAVWMSGRDARHRALYFIAEHLVIVLDKKDIVNDMHEAYDRIDFDDLEFGVFISGPSKTADIEQSLVIGAHGAKSSYVIFVD